VAGELSGYFLYRKDDEGTDEVDHALPESNVSCGAAFP